MLLTSLLALATLASAAPAVGDKPSATTMARPPRQTYTRGPAFTPFLFDGYIDRGMMAAITASKPDGSPDVRPGQGIVYNDGTGNWAAQTVWYLQWGQTYIHVNANKTLCLAAGADCDGTRNPKLGQQAFIAECDDNQMEWRDKGGPPLTTQWHYENAKIRLRLTNYCLALEGLPKSGENPHLGAKVVLVDCKDGYEWDTFPYNITDCAYANDPVPGKPICDTAE